MKQESEREARERLAGLSLSLLAPVKPTDEEIAREAARMIHWYHVKQLDAYGQEEAARTTKLVLAAIKKAKQ